LLYAFIILYHVTNYVTMIKCSIYLLFLYKRKRKIEEQKKKEKKKIQNIRAQNKTHIVFTIHLSSTIVW